MAQQSDLCHSEQPGLLRSLWIVDRASQLACVVCGHVQVQVLVCTASDTAYVHALEMFLQQLGSAFTTVVLTITQCVCDEERQNSYHSMTCTVTELWQQDERAGRKVAECSRRS